MTEEKRYKCVESSRDTCYTFFKDVVTQDLMDMEDTEELLNAYESRVKELEEALKQYQDDRFKDDTTFQGRPYNWIKGK